MIEPWFIPAMDSPIHLALRRVVELAGGQKALADICGTQKQNINQAMLARRGLPARFVPAVAERFNIPKSELRPDLFGPEEAK